jgi:hypothetical protein
LNTSGRIKIVSGATKCHAALSLESALEEEPSGNQPNTIPEAAENVYLTH